MLFFVAVNVFLLGFVHKAVSTPCLDKIPKCGGGCGGGGGGGGGGSSNSVSEFSETVKSSASSASSTFESSSYGMTSSSSSCSSSFDESYWMKIFEKCSFIPETEWKCYLKWLAMFSDDCLTYYTNIAEYFSIQEALSKDILDFTLLQTDIVAAYDFFSSNSCYCLDTDLTTKIAIFEEYKSKLTQTLSCLGPNTPLYNLLKYSLETDITSLACTIGMLNSIIKSQDVYFSSSTQITNSERSVTESTTTAVMSTESSVDVSQYETIFQTANIESVESQLYLSYLSKLASDKMCFFTEIIDFLNKDTQVLTKDMFLDFMSYNQEIQSIYESLVAQQFFIEKADWLAKETILMEIKSKLTNALGFLCKDCCFYHALQYCLEQDISLLPVYIGLNHYLLQQQSEFFSMASSSTSFKQESYSSSSASGSSSICV